MRAGDPGAHPEAPTAASPACAPGETFCSSASIRYRSYVAMHLPRVTYGDKTMQVCTFVVPWRVYLWRVPMRGGGSLDVTLDRRAMLLRSCSYVDTAASGGRGRYLEALPYTA